MKTEKVSSWLGYRVGLNRIQESVISSHFMHRISQNSSLNLYQQQDFQAKLLRINQAQLVDGLIPILAAASTRFCKERANAAYNRAAAKWREYGLDNSSLIGASEAITETLLDKQFSRNGARYNERSVLNDRLKNAIDRNRRIEMVIPALPFKISSPLKSRGSLPDLGEANFLLSLYEIARTVEMIYRAERPDHQEPLARFTVVADGYRFNEAVNKSSTEIEAYQAALNNWVEILGVGEYLRIVDYRSLLRKGLSTDILSAKQEILRHSRTAYADALWPIFDPNDMSATFQAATKVELDPEHGNPEGRFVTLLKSLVYTINYKTLRSMNGLSDENQAELYRELTAHLFEPYSEDNAPRECGFSSTHSAIQTAQMTSELKEELRRSMLREVWAAAIDYIAEIKSDRDLDEDPILSCLPEHLRWTIHAKGGQIAIATPPILGICVQAWASSAVFRHTTKGKVRLCSLPALLLEATEAIPVGFVPNDDGHTSSQPLFYIDKNVGAESIEDLLVILRDKFTRQRFS
jgi:hypothetical protein